MDDCITYARCHWLVCSLVNNVSSPAPNPREKPSFYRITSERWLLDLQCWRSKIGGNYTRGLIRFLLVIRLGDGRVQEPLTDGLTNDSIQSSALTLGKISRFRTITRARRSRSGLGRRYLHDVRPRMEGMLKYRLEQFHDPKYFSLGGRIPGWSIWVVHQV